MRLIGSPLSPFVMRCVLAARLKGENLPLEMPEGGLKSPGFLALSPIGKMPVLIDGDLVLPESAAIVEYLDDVLDGPPLLPDVPEGRAIARMLALVAHEYLMPALAALFIVRDAAALPEGAMDRLGKALDYLEALRPAHARCLATDEPTVADATAMPMFFYLDALDPAFGTARLIDARPGLARWWSERCATELGTGMIQEMTAALAAFRASR